MAGATSVTLLLSGLSVIGLGALAALAFARSPAKAAPVAAALIGSGCALGLTAAIKALTGAEEQVLRAAWPVPMGSFYVRIDGLSALFLAVIFFVSALSAIYGVGYMRGSSARQAAVAWPMFAVLVGAMALVVVAYNAVLFLVAWEVMALSSYFLVTLNDGTVEVRNAGKTYLIATHLGTAFLLVMFLMLGAGQETLDFDNFRPSGSAGPVMAGAMFLFAVIGFGAKAGLMPFHVWLPVAHPAAPSPVSALMSGVMVKIGIYGLLRFTVMAGEPAAWWGWVMVGAGLVSGVMGGLSAIAHHDIKRLLAYHTVENIGIIALGIGAGLLGMSYGSPVMVVLGFGGALFHTLNHAIFKSLLFLGAGAVVHATGTRDVEKLGGLLKRMPWTAAFFIVGAVAIAGLPPLNGFLGEFLIFRSGLAGGLGDASNDAAAVITLVGGLAVIGTLTAGAFGKAVGIVFLGEPRSDAAKRAHEAPPGMLLPMAALAAACFVIAFSGPYLMAWLARAVSPVAGMPADVAEKVLRESTGSLYRVMAVFGLLLALAAGLTLLRWRVLARRPVGRAVTWDCGYAAPTARMQYTASSFAEPVTTLFAPLLRSVRHVVRPSGLFPVRASFESYTPDVLSEVLYRRTAASADRFLVRLRWLQHGRINIYVLYIAVTLVALLVWKVGFA